MTTLDDLRTLTVDDVARILDVRPEAVRIYAREGRLEAMRWGRRLRFRPEAILDFQNAAAVKVPDPREFIERMRREKPRRPRRPGQGGQSGQGQ